VIDVIQILNEIFGELCLISCEEVLYNFQIRYQIAASDLPSAEKLVELCHECIERDDFGIQFHSVENFSFSNGGILSHINEYDDYKLQLEQDDIVKVTIKIQKKFVDETISVYSIEKFSDFLCKQKIEESFQLFSGLFANGRQHICFQILNGDSYIHTSSIAFGGGQLSWDSAISRSNYIRNCNDSSVFLGRAQYPLVPQDFTIIEHVYDSSFNRIKELFDRLKMVLSYLYIANTSNIVGNKAILQFDPAVNGYEYTLEQLSENNYAWEIYNWIYKDDGCVDRASIARNIINVHCRTAEDILSIGENIYNSAVANHVIYQKKHADQYIELKNKLSEFIVESAKQLQELAHDLVEGFRNNFVAVIVFLMTVLLTDSIDFTSFTQVNVSSNIVAVCGIFTFASLLYMIVTIIAGNTKWGWLAKSYYDLKCNYRGILDEQDIEVAVNNDSAFKNTEKEYKRVRLLISCIWIFAIVGMMVFTLVIGFNSRNDATFSEKIHQSKDQAMEQSDSESLETEMNIDEEEKSSIRSFDMERKAQESSN